MEWKAFRKEREAINFSSGLTHDTVMGVVSNGGGVHVQCRDRLKYAGLTHCSFFTTRRYNRVPFGSYDLPLNEKNFGAFLYGFRFVSLVCPIFICPPTFCSHCKAFFVSDTTCKSRIHHLKCNQFEFANKYTL